MILQRLTLRDFCLYQGEQTFELEPVTPSGKPAPIVLFGGINGGGKTTLLDAVQLVLYGVRARCSKRTDKTYEQFLQESIHAGADPGDGAAVQLAFRYAAQGRQQLYEVTRSWSLVRQRIREKVEVRRDGEPDRWMSDNWSQLVEELIPFGIAQLCFFDAEKIRFLAEDETSTQALGDAIKSLLGLDLAERLVADAGVLETRIAKRAPKSADLEEVQRLDGELAVKQAAIDQLVRDMGSLQNPRLQAVERVKAAEEEFARIGGQHWNQRDARQRRAAELEQLTRDIEERLVGLAATELPLALLRSGAGRREGADLLRAAAERAKGERRAAEAVVIARVLVERDERLLGALRQRRTAAKTIELVRKLLEEDRLGRVPLDEEEAGRRAAERLGLSETGRGLLAHLRDTGLPERLREAQEALERYEQAQRELTNVQRGLKAIPEEATVREVAERLKTAAHELAGLEQQYGRLEKQVETLRSERKQLQADLEKRRRKVIDEELRSEEHARMAQLLSRTQQTMRQFLHRATASKIDRLSGLITDSLGFLLRKRSLVQRVQVDPATFAITLYDNHDRAVPKQRLSEGEKQIFALSVLWGLSRASARPLPAIIDTPMARLDSKHRQHLVERYFPLASHQVIVLSTDTEIERRYFHDLRPQIARAYHLDYDEEHKVTRGREGYFWE